MSPPINPLVNWPDPTHWPTHPSGQRPPAQRSYWTDTPMDRDPRQRPPGQRPPDRDSLLTDIHLWKHYLHTHMHMHVHAHMYDIIAIPRDSPNWGCHLHEIIMFTTHACVYMHACTCMCTCMGVPHQPHSHTTTPIPPKSHREPKSPKFNKSWTNQDHSILFEDSLPLNTAELI